MRLLEMEHKGTGTLLRRSPHEEPVACAARF